MASLRRDSISLAKSDIHLFLQSLNVWTPFSNGTFYKMLLSLSRATLMVPSRVSRRRLRSSPNHIVTMYLAAGFKVFKGVHMGT